MFRIPPQYLSSIFIPICIITSNIVTFTVFTVKNFIIIIIIYYYYYYKCIISHEQRYDPDDNIKLLLNS